MEGFDPAKLDEILGLREKGLRSVTILPLGYREPEGDWLVNLKRSAARSRNSPAACDFHIVVKS